MPSTPARRQAPASSRRACRTLGAITAAAFSAIALVLLASPAEAQKKSRAREPAPAAETEQTRASPPLLRFTDADSEVFLLGTFHVLPPDLDWRSDALGRAIDRAEVILFEAEVDTPAAQQKAAEILAAEGRNPPGVTLTSLLGEDDGARLGEIVDELRLPRDTVDRMRPWQANLLLAVQFIASQGFTPGSGVETVLLREARLRGRELRFLETVEDQLGLFTGLSPEAELSLLRLTVAEWNDQQTEFRQLFDAWARGDGETIGELMNAAMRSQAPEVYQALIASRNEAWAETIAALLNRPGVTLVAVGAGHLAGPDSVPALLRARGIDVARVE